ncbi:MAG: adenosylcobinamide-GDP ribazoletransferase [Desulfococcaceae bacterium]|nr:adenosylcobinamide-GDP ribazoletransferase [Desulfococcaceae bacterium]
MKGFISALQFITILPFGRPGTFAPSAMLRFFPLAGLLLGGLLAVFDCLAGLIWPRQMVSVLDMVFMVWITGAFHADGLGDTADGLYGNRPREKALEIMKDSRIGAMALVTVFCTLTVKWSAIAGLDSHRSLFLLIIPAYARGGMLFGFRFLPYGRPGGGTGHALFAEKIKWAEFSGLLIPFFLSLFCGWRGLLLNLVFVCIVAALLCFYQKRMGCITGDMLGAMTEITEAALFLAVAAGGRI